jgi:hypothetical protein
MLHVLTYATTKPDHKQGGLEIYLGHEPNLSRTLFKGLLVDAKGVDSKIPSCLVEPW